MVVGLLVFRFRLDILMTGVKIVGKDSLIGAGAVIIRDVEDGATVVGNPGRIIKQKYP